MPIIPNPLAGVTGHRPSASSASSPDAAKSLSAKSCGHQVLGGKTLGVSDAGEAKPGWVANASRAMAQEAGANAVADASHINLEQHMKTAIFDHHDKQTTPHLLEVRTGSVRELLDDTRQNPKRVLENSNVEKVLQRCI